MNKTVKIISLIILQGLLGWDVLASHPEEWNWYEWGIWIILTIGIVLSLIYEFCSSEEYLPYSNNNLKIFNTIIIGYLLWKMYYIELPISQILILLIVFAIGLLNMLSIVKKLKEENARIKLEKQKIEQEKKDAEDKLKKIKKELMISRGLNIIKSLGELFLP